MRLARPCPEAARDLRWFELALVVPLVACLLTLSAWPAAISDRALPPRAEGSEPRRDRHADRRLAGPVALAGAPRGRGPVPLGAVLVPAIARRPFSAVLLPAALSRPGSSRNRVRPLAERRGADRRDDGSATDSPSTRRSSSAAPACSPRSRAGATAAGATWASTTRCSRSRARDALLRRAGAITFLGLEWFSIALYVLCALDTQREHSLEAGLKYLIVGSFGSSILLFSALVYGATGELGFGAIREYPARTTPSSWSVSR